MRYKSLSPSQRAPTAKHLPGRPAAAGAAPARPEMGRVRRARDIVAVLIMIALVPGLVIPHLRTSASGPQLAVSGPVHAAESVEVTGTGFQAATRVALLLDGAQVSHARANLTGSFRASVTIPADAAPGDHALAAAYQDGRGNGRRKATGTSDAIVATAVVTVVEREEAPEPTSAPTSPTAQPSSSAEPTRTPDPAETPPPTVAPSSSPTPTQPPPPNVDGAFVVAVDGNDASAGTAVAPWRTLQHAASRVQPGSKVLVRGGTYAGFTLSRSGTSNEPIVFASYPGEDAVIAGGNSTVNVVRLAGVHDIVIRGITVQGAAGDRTGAGIRIDNGSYRVTVANSLLRENRSYGVSIVDSTEVMVRDNEITGNAEGVYVLRAGSGVVVRDNRIHHQDRMVVATVGGNDDHGGVGVALVRTSGTVTVRDNRIWGNRAVSPDYGYDGGAYEIFAASNVVISGNVAWDNRNVIETGSDGAACRNNVFVRNVHYGATTVDVSKGMVLRCAEDMLIANNTFHRLDQFVFDIQSGGGWGTSVAGMRILNNIAVMATGKIYGVEAGALSSVAVNRNLVWHENGGVIGSLTGYGSTSSFGTFQAWTGFDASGVNARPNFVDSAKVDLRLAPESPAVDRAMVLNGITSPYLGSAPDIGRYESH